jgi:hypothetical protein
VWMVKWLLQVLAFFYLSRTVRLWDLSVRTSGGGGGAARCTTCYVLLVSPGGRAYEMPRPPVVAETYLRIIVKERHHGGDSVMVRCSNLKDGRLEGKMDSVAPTSFA